MRKNISESHRIERLQEWYASPYAKVLHDHIWSSLKIYLQRIPVQSFIPVGLPLTSDKPLHVNMGKQISLVGSQQAVNVSDLTLQDNLPLDTDSQSCLVYHHLLDVLDNPYQLLREASRVLDDAGYLIVIGLNPLSLYGASRLLRFPYDYFKQDIPWSLKAYSYSKLVNWLRVLEFIPASRESHGFVPPLMGSYGMAMLDKTEPSLSKWSARGGMVNIMLFRKNLAPVTPIRTRWKVTSVKMPRGKLRPSTNISAHNKGYKKHKNEEY